jgi:hypothetical protein
MIVRNIKLKECVNRRQILDLWPYLLIAVSAIGLLVRLVRGRFLGKVRNGA